MKISIISEDMMNGGVGDNNENGMRISIIKNEMEA